MGFSVVTYLLLLLLQILLLLLLPLLPLLLVVPPPSLSPETVTFFFHHSLSTLFADPSDARGLGETLEQVFVAEFFFFFNLKETGNTILRRKPPLSRLPLLPIFGLVSFFFLRSFTFFFSLLVAISSPKFLFSGKGSCGACTTGRSTRSFKESS